MDDDSFNISDILKKKFWNDKDTLPLAKYRADYTRTNLFLTLVELATEKEKEEDSFPATFRRDVAKRMGELYGETTTLTGDQGILSAIVMEYICGMFSNVSLYDQMICEMTYCKIVDSFMVYLSEVLSLVFRTEPKILSNSKETVSVEAILRHGDMTGLIDSLIEDKVQKLAYLGIRDVQRFVKDRLGVDLFDTQQEWDVISMALETRNILVHNRGVVNTTILKRLPDSPVPLGERVVLNDGNIKKQLREISEIARNIDLKMSEKFSPPVFSIQEHNQNPLVRRMFSPVRYEDIIDDFARRNNMRREGDLLVEIQPVDISAAATSPADNPD